VVFEIDVSKSFVPVYSNKNRNPSFFVFKPNVRVVNNTYAGSATGMVLDYEKLMSGTDPMEAGVGYVAIVVTNGAEVYSSISNPEYFEFVDQYGNVYPFPVGFYQVTGIPEGTYSATAFDYTGTQALTEPQEIEIIRGNYTEVNFVVMDAPQPPME